jgi:hypothetical protein
MLKLEVLRASAKLMPARKAPMIAARPKLRPSNQASPAGQPLGSGALSMRRRLRWKAYRRILRVPTNARKAVNRTAWSTMMATSRVLTEPVVASRDHGADDHGQGVIDHGRAENDARFGAGEHGRIAEHAGGGRHAGATRAAPAKIDSICGWPSTGAIRT